MKVLVAGASGLLGSTLVPFLDSRGYEVITHSRNDRTQYHADLTDASSVRELLTKIKPDAIVNLVGLTNVDHCETQPNLAYLTNVRTIENIAAWIKQGNNNHHLIQISTDQVYDGNTLHQEADVTLTNYYAFSKYAGELVASTIPSSILRTNFFGRSKCENRSSLSDWLFSSLVNSNPISVFDDVKFSPLSMNTLSKTIEEVIQKKPIGIFNVGSHNGMSKSDFAFAFAKELDFATNAMLRTTSDQAGFLKTYRPKDMRMNCAKFEKTLDLKLPNLNDEIIQVARDYNEVTEADSGHSR